MSKSSIAKAYVQVIPSMEGVKNSLTSGFGGAGQSAGSAFGANLIGKVKGMIAAAGLGTVIKETLSAGADLQQSLGGIETLFGDSAGIVIANAESAYKRAGLSANSYMEAVTGFSASLLQGLGGDTAEAAKVADMALTDMSDNANKMGTSMESIQYAYQGFAKQNYTMLDNLKLGYGGTKSEMERLLADAQKLTGVKYDINNLADVYSAIHVVQEELGIAGATAEEAEKTFSGSFSSMKAASTDLLGNLTTGRDIGPSLSAVQETVHTFLVGNLFPMVGNLLSALPSVIGGGFSVAIQGLNVASENADAILQMGLDLVTGIGTAVIENGPALWDAVISLGSSLWSAGTELAADIGAGIAAGAPQLIESGLGALSDLLHTVTSQLPQFLENGIVLMGQFAAGLIAGIPDALFALGKFTLDLLMVFDEIDWDEVGHNIVQGIIDGLLGAGEALLDAISGLADWCLGQFQSDLDINSPSGVMRDQVGKFIPEGVAVGIVANTQPLKNAMSDLSDITTTSLRADLELPAARMRPVAASGMVRGDTYINVHVNCGEVQNPREIAQYVAEEIQRKEESEESAL